MDRNHIIKELHKDNLCTYFILPLLKLSKFRFIADSNFIDSYLSQDRKYIIVQVLEILFLEYKLAEHPDFEGVYKDNHGHRFIAYAIPDRFTEDVEHFCSGQYSNMSDEAKELIRSYSGLTYKVRDKKSGLLITDVRLLALHKSQSLRDMWEDALACTLHDDQELLSIPGETSFISMDSIQRIGSRTRLYS